MAHYTHNAITHGLHGRFDNLVFRVWAGRTIACKPPTFTKPWSNLQKENRRRFREATVLAKTALKDPETRRYYEARLRPRQNAWNAAVADYMKKPEIRQIDTSRYEGRPGQEIRIGAADNYRVASVIVTILSALGLVIETGPAVQLQEGILWSYTAKESNPAPAGCRVMVQVTDSPGNVTQDFRVIGDS